MPVVTSRAYFPVFLNEWTGRLSTFWLRLFKNDIEPGEDDDVTDYVEADFSGYPPGGYALPAWRPADLNEDGIGEKQHETVVFVHGPPGLNCQVYGWYMTDSLGELVMAERDPEGPTYLNTPGQSYPVTPRVTLRNDPGLPDPEEPADATDVDLRRPGQAAGSRRRGGAARRGA